MATIEELTSMLQSRVTPASGSPKQSEESPDSNMNSLLKALQERASAGKEQPQPEDNPSSPNLDINPQTPSVPTPGTVEPKPEKSIGEKISRFMSNAAREILPMRELEYTAKSLQKSYLKPAEMILEKASNDILGTEFDTEETRKELKELQDYLVKVDGGKANTAQEILSQMVLFAPKTLLGSAILEGVLNSITEVGEDGQVDWKELRGDFLVGAGIGAGTKIIGHGLDHLVSRPLHRYAGVGIDPEIYKWAERKQIPKEQVDEWIGHLPKDMQMTALANRTGLASEGIIKMAAEGSDDRTLEIMRRAAQRGKDIKDSLSVQDPDEFLKIAKDNYKSMEETFKNSNIGINLSQLFDDIDIQKLPGWENNPTLNKLIGTKAGIEDKPVKSIKEVLSMRSSLNEAIAKADKQHQHQLLQVKDRLDQILMSDAIMPKEFVEVFEQVNDTYKMANQSKEIHDTLNKFTNEDGIVNYKSVRDELKSKDWNSTEKSKLIDLLEDMDTKFNADYRVNLKSKGSNPKEGWLGIWSSLLGMVKKAVIRWGEYGNDVYVQDLIAKDLKTSRTPFELANKIVKNDKIPDEVVSKFSELISQSDNADLTRYYKMSELDTLSNSVKERSSKMYLKLQGKQLEIEKGEKKIAKALTSINTAKRQGASPSTLDKLHDDLDMLYKEQELKVKSYSLSKMEFDKMGVSVEKLKYFGDLPQAEDLPAVKGIIRGGD